MNENRELTALFTALEAAPDDDVTRQALADWYEDNDMPAAADCLRWVVTTRKQPYRYYKDNPIRYHHESWGEGWYWWAHTKPKEEWGYPDGCKLPFPLWDRLLHGFDYDPTTFKEYQTVRATLEALIAAWAATPAEERPSR
jgi:uncharacterized protein (TIGR02996 family)